MIIYIYIYIYIYIHIYSLCILLYQFAYVIITQEYINADLLKLVFNAQLLSENTELITDIIFPDVGG